MIKETAKVLKGTPMEILISAILVRVKLMEKEFTPGKMVKCLMENGIKG